MKDYFLVARLLIVLICFTSSSLNNTVIADDRQVIDYYYDMSGNIIEKNTNVTLNSLAPSTSTINPSVVRRNAVASVTVNGSDLKNVQISPDHPGLTVGNIDSSNTQSTFDLKVSSDVPLGAHTLLFSTLSGQVAQNIEVYPQLPQMVIRPTPLALAVGSTTQVLFGVSSADVIDHQITVSIADPSIISTAATTFTIVAGERFPVSFLNVAGLSLGTTTLTFSSAELGDQVFTVVVGNPYQPPVGTQVNVRSDLLGLVLPTNSPDIKQLGPLTSSLSVFLTPVIAPIDNNQLLQASSLVNVVFGRAFTQLSPNVVAANKNIVVTIDGHGLSDVTSIAITPSDGITVGALQVNPTGTQLTVSVNVASNIGFSTRRIHLLAAGTEIKPAKPVVSRLFVGGAPPIIETVAPVVASRLSNQPLNITGQFFDGDVKVKIAPPDDISIGNIVTVNGDHTALSVDMDVGEYAALGPRVVTVQTANGSTTLASLSINTLTIANAIAGETPVTSFPLGVVVGSGSTASTNIDLFSPELSIIRGAGVTSIQPLSSMTGTTVTLTIKGYELASVSAVNFEPAQGVSVGAPQIAADGLSLTVDVTIDASAQITTRQLTVVSAGTNLPFIKSEFSRFDILGPLPVVNFISPNFIVAGNTSVIDIHGDSIDTVNSVRIDPSQGLTVSAPQLNADNSIATVQVTADLTAPRGNHTLIVSSASGESTAIPSAANQLNVVDAEVLTVNSSLVSPLLGVLKGSDPTSVVTHDYTVASDLLGILIPESPTTATQSYYGQKLSVVKGGYVGSVSPDAMQVGTTSSVIISGVGMQDVSAIEVLPSDGVTVQSPLMINAGATEVTVDIVVAADAAKTLRQIIVHQNGDTTSRLPFVKADASLIAIAGGLPTIDSISPVLQVANSQFELLVRGQGMQEVTAVNAYDGNGTLESLIVFGTPAINVDGTELRVPVIVDRLVPSGTKAIVLAVPVGQTNTVPTPVNTLTIDTVIN